MESNVKIRPDVEVSGASGAVMLDAMKLYDPSVEKLLAKHNLQEMRADQWYPLRTLIDGLRLVAREVGGDMLFSIGKRVPEMAMWPPDITDVDAGLSSIDVAYHMNHRDSEGALFNPATGKMREGIGHYSYKSTGPSSGVMVCDTPYPTELDRGIVEGTARKWKPSAKVVLDPSKPTRSSGGESCTYLIEW